MISDKTAEEIIDILEKKLGGFVEVFAENSQILQIYRKNSCINKVVNRKIEGVGIRIIREGIIYFISTNNLSRSNILYQVEKLLYLVNNRTEKRKYINCYNNCRDKGRNRNLDNINNFLKKNEKCTSLIDKSAKRYNQIKQIEIENWDINQDIFVANSNGISIQENRKRFRIITKTTAEKDGRIEYNLNINGTSNVENMYEQIDPETIGKVCAKQNIELLNADICPTGKMPIIIAGGMGGSLFHEACGHSLEASGIMCVNSEFSDKLGKRIASPLVTIIDDGTINGKWGTNLFDDEGIPCKKNILVERGILKGYLIDYLSSICMNLPATGNGRRESFCFLPTARMSNTYIAAGNNSEQEIVSSVDFGIYVDEFRGGSVNPKTGEFNVGILRGYLIKNGQKDRLIKGGTLIGKGSEILKKIDKVADNVTWGQGMCGSKSGLIPVGMGQPMIRIKEGIVGGSKYNGIGKVLR